MPPWPWSGFGFGYTSLVQIAAPAIIQAPFDLTKPHRSRSVLAPPTLDHWCRAPQATPIWLDPSLVQTVYGSILHIYVLGCGGLMRLHRKLGGSMFKIGTTQAASPQARTAGLIRCRYGSRFRCESRWSEEEPGFDNWKTEAPALDIFPSPASPVSLTNSSLVVRLPLALSPEDFDIALNQRLRTVAVDRWVRQAAVRRELTLHDIDPNLGIRGKQVAKGLVEEVSEIFFFRKKHEFAALVAIAEDIVLQSFRKRA